MISVCLRCGYEWTPKNFGVHSVRCARCRSKYWNIPRQKRGYKVSKYLVGKSAGGTEMFPAANETLSSSASETLRSGNSETLATCASETTLVTVLCSSSRSEYFKMSAVEVFDKKRDARTWPGGNPVIAHPPCRAWSAFCSHQAKPEPGEKALGLWCAEMVVRHGGILEQPAHSKLWRAAGLPVPDKRNGLAVPSNVVRSDLWAAEVWQSWWGYSMRKKTWLLFSKIPPEMVSFPLKYHTPGRDRRAQQLMTHRERSHTCPAFAQWLVSAARLAKRA
jgi:hypothetical protein